MGQMMVNGARTQPRTRRATLVVWSVRALRKGAVLARGVSVGASRGSLLMRPWPLGLGGKGKIELVEGSGTSLASLRFARLRAVEMRRRRSCCLAVGRERRHHHT